METNPARGHLAALLTIVIWGTTFISTKVLLVDFQPVEILFIRFMMGFLALLAVCPRRLQGVTRRQEGLFALAGLCGVCLYYLLENIALTYTMASNVGVIISVSPCFTALLTHFLMRGEERLRPTFFAGFAVAMAGICLISFNGSALELDLRGDLLALLAAFVWACYALLSRKISALGHPTVLTTRRTFFYGLAFMLPALMVSGVRLELTRLTAPVNLGNLLFLGLGASALCFVTWNFAVKALGAVKTSVYIYLVPVITVAASVLILREPFTWMTGCFSLKANSIGKREHTMKQELDKCVLVIDEAMPRGLAANTAAILGITWGRLRPELVGEDVTDAAGAIHPGIIRTPVPVLSGRPGTFQTLRRQLAELEFADVAAVDFTDLAQSCRTYGEFIEKMARTGPGELRYLGMALLGPRHQVDRLTGSLPLLR